MHNEELVSIGLQFLADKGWSEIVDGRWEEEVKKDLLDGFPDMDEKTLQEIIDVVIW